MRTTKLPVEFFDVPLEIRPSEQGGFIAFNDELQVVVQGDTEASAEQQFRDAVREILRFCFERRLPFPEALRLA